MRLIDADALLEQMKGMNMLFSPKIVIDNMPTIDEQAIKADERAKVKNCDGCKHKGKWEVEIEYGYPSPCTTCSRRCVDNYEVN